jgi:hypothetical protein
MTPNLLAKFINSKNYDVRIINNGRWIDQKCAYDNLCFVADCIVEHIRDKGDKPFTSPEIWRSDYAVKNVQLWYGKPDPLIGSTLDEYNKFFRMQMKLLAASGVLEENKKGSTIEFKVSNIDILEYIAIRERNSFDFLCLYIEKTLKDSGLLDSFESFFDEQNKTYYDILKAKFSKFCIDNTPINTEREANRIFIKVLNPLACRWNKKGTIRGSISSSPITIAKIAYNQANWRDIIAGKDKNVARGDFISVDHIPPMYTYKVSRASKNLRKFNDKYNGKKSEVLDKFSIGEIATHMHHIFPQNEFREIADFIENLIALTSGQHLQRAHPNGKTRIIDPDYQYTCLISKTESIRKNLMDINGEPEIYNFEDFMFVLDTGFKTDFFGRIQSHDFNSVINGIEFNH